MSVPFTGRAAIAPEAAWLMYSEKCSHDVPSLAHITMPSETLRVLVETRWKCRGCSALFVILTCLRLNLDPEQHVYNQCIHRHFSER